MAFSCSWAFGSQLASVPFLLAARSYTILTFSFSSNIKQKWWKKTTLRHSVAHIFPPVRREEELLYSSQATSWESSQINTVQHLHHPHITESLENEKWNQQVSIFLPANLQKNKYKKNDVSLKTRIVVTYR